MPAWDREVVSSDGEVAARVELPGWNYAGRISLVSRAAVRHGTDGVE